MLQKIQIVGRILIIVLFIYSVLFTLVGTIFLVKAHSFVFGQLDEIQAMRDTPPAMSRFMEDLVDSNPKVNIQHRFVPLDSISINLRKAVIAVEDPAFYMHPGFDVRSMAKAMDANMTKGELRYGGSTITQQLAKNLFLTGERTWERKLKELVYAVVMERNLGKDRILELYLNYAQWGRNVFGCEAASQIYYKVHCSELSLQQATNLAAMLASPGNSEPEDNSELMQRRRKVIQQNLKDGALLP